MRQSQRELSAGHSTYLHPIIAMLIESGMLMLAAQMAWVIVFKLKSPSFYMLAGPMVMIYVCIFRLRYTSFLPQSRHRELLQRLLEYALHWEKHTKLV